MTPIIKNVEGSPKGPEPAAESLFWSEVAGAEALLKHGMDAMNRRDYTTAANLFAGAGGAQPGYGPANLLFNRAVRQLVPRWHFAMLNDQARNEAYRKAISAVVRPGDLVLDIGTGAGLLSLLAVEAGAGMVVTCEMEPVIAAIARRTMVVNGVDSRVKVVEAKSTDLRVGVDLPRRADVLLTEIFDCALLGEGALPSLEHARRELLRPDAVVAPQGARLWGRLVESEELFARNHVGNVYDFDMTLFQQFRSMEYFSTYLTGYRHRLLGDPFPLFDFDFRTGECERERVVPAPVTADGTCHAIVMWFELDLAEGITLSNGPEDHGTHWRQAVQTFERPLPCRAGEPLRLLASHDDDRVLVRPGPLGAAPGGESVSGHR
ncbi:50S ribosomal protein L11 methyltransferase [Streptosporangium sp. NPDC050855]|uniref:50S ribosomal protein L11 methyltransferase n=1 Tax=Streptosporangium sp. NPDC050855 TaxID=3366194 RepID=UPI003799232A